MYVRLSEAGGSAALLGSAGALEGEAWGEVSVLVSVSVDAGNSEPDAGCDETVSAEGTCEGTLGFAVGVNLRDLPWIQPTKGDA